MDEPRNFIPAADPRTQIMLLKFTRQTDLQLSVARDSFISIYLIRPFHSSLFLSRANIKSNPQEFNKTERTFSLEKKVDTQKVGIPEANLTLMENEIFPALEKLSRYLASARFNYLIKYERA